MIMIISIIIPTYNRAKKIAEALKSIQTQTFQDWEVIVVDDGSKDNTQEQIQQCIQKDTRIRYIRHDINRGAQAARNTGIKAAKGEWISFLDSDDQWLPESLELRMKLAQKDNSSVVHSQAYIQHKDKPLEIYYLPAWSGWIYKKILTREGPMFQSLLVKKEALKKIGYLDEKVIAYQEWDTSIRLAKLYPFSFEPAPTFIYDYTCADSISRNSIRAAKGYEYILRKNLKDILFYAGSSTMAYHYDIAANWYQDGGDQKNAQRCKLNSLIWKLLSPTIIFRKLKILLSGNKTIKNN